MQGLPFDAVLGSNTAGWVRSPATEESSQGNIWNVTTNKKRYDRRNSFDIQVYYSKTSGNPYTLSRSFEVSSQLSSWELTGNISYEGNMPNASNIQQYLDVLDIDDKILIRFYIETNFTTASVKCNGLTLFTDNHNDIEAVTNFYQALKINMVANVLTVTYGDFTPVVVSKFDGTASSLNPKTLRLLFTGNEGQGYGKLISIDQFRFNATI
jgi:hypothetical protein